MKITELTVTGNPAKANPRPVTDALQTLSGGGSIRVTVLTDEGVSGSADIGFGRIAGAYRTLTALVEHELRPLVLGADPSYVREIRRKMLTETEYHGSSGITMFGIAAVDTALWDCIGRSMGVPCWKLWGRANRIIKAYAMVGWLNYSDAEVREICASAVKQGFRAVKVKVGYPTLREDIARIGAVRDAVGDSIEIMVDANQSLTVSEALIRGRAFQEIGCRWWEEPIPADDIDGYAELARSLDIPVAAGENLYTPADFARFFRAGAVDIVQPDLRRAGGPTALLEIGNTAAAFGIIHRS